MTETPGEYTVAEKPRRPRRLWQALVIIVLAALAWTPWIDRSANDYYSEAFSRALITFGIARALNGVVSVIQGTEVSLHPAGVGVTLAPGELVDPINDLIERFSWVMLASSTSLGIQSILMEISAWWGIAAIVTLGAVVWLLLIKKRRWRRVALRFFLLALFLRFAVPGMVLLSHGIYEMFMADDYAAATTSIEKTREDLEEMVDQDEIARDGNEDAGFMQSVGDWFADKANALNVRERLTLYREKMAGATEHFLRLAAVFVLQTIVLPLLFLWVFGRALKNIGTLLGGGNRV